MKKEKKTLLKCFSYFRKLNFSTPSLKDSYFLGERLFIAISLNIFTSPLIFAIGFGSFYC